MTDPSGECPWCLVGAAIGGGWQAYQEHKAGSFKNGYNTHQAHMAELRIAGSAALGAVGGGAATAIGKVFAGETFAAISTRIAANTLVGTGTGATGATISAATQGRAPTSGELEHGAIWGGIFSAAGSSLGEGISGIGQSAASSQVARSYDPSDMQVQFSEAPSYTQFNVSPPDVSSHPLTQMGNIVGNTAGTVVGNAPAPEQGVCASSKGGCGPGGGADFWK
jgi:hypothetical protein